MIIKKDNRGGVLAAVTISSSHHCTKQWQK